MRTRSSIRHRSAALGVRIVLALLACAPTLSQRAGATEKGIGIRFVYHSFTESTMKDCYDNVPILMAERLVRKGHHGASLELGCLHGEGEPIIPQSEWRVAGTSLTMWAAPFSLNYLYYFASGPTRTLGPYAGVGIGALFGLEKIGARARTLLKESDTWAWGARGSMIGNLFLGTRIRGWRRLDAVVEARWIQSGRGWNADLADEEEQSRLDEYLYPLAERPSFDFSGFSLSLGLRW